MIWLRSKINIKIFKGDRSMIIKLGKHIKDINNNHILNIINLVWLNNQALKCHLIVYLNYKQKLNLTFDDINII